MNLEQIVQSNTNFGNLDLLAKQIVEGFISGLHKSPFHGFSAEFAEHKIYNPGESTKHVDWKLFAKTDKLFTKRYDDETNLRCHFILDNSSSMHYPMLEKQQVNSYNKIGFSVLAIASLLRILKKQRDAVGLSIYSDNYEFFASEKGNERQHALLLHTLENTLKKPPNPKKTKTSTLLHEIAENLHKRSLVVLFSDMLVNDSTDEIFEALRHLKYNKHEVILFHTLDYDKEVNLNFDNTPQRFLDVETNEFIDLYAANIQTDYSVKVKSFVKDLEIECRRYKIIFKSIDVQRDIYKVLREFLLERKKIL